MACFHPLTGWLPRTGGNKLTFKANEGYLDQPRDVACGQCSGCRLERSRQWAARCLCEDRMHSKSAFLTLTYDDAHLPADRSLDVTHWQKFAKRLRKRIGPFRFYHCGEYGNPPTASNPDDGDRPHYHALLWGYDFPDRSYYTTSNGHDLYLSPLLDEVWEKGLCPIGDVTFESAAYVARYIMKKQTGKNAGPRYEERVDQDTGEIDYYYKPPYTTMSRNPGIAATWFHKFRSDVFPRDELLVNGKLSRPPKFFDYLEALDDPEAIEHIKAQRVKRARRYSEDNTPDRRADREKLLSIKQARSAPRHLKKL